VFLRGGHGCRVLESTPEGFFVFLSNGDPVLESKICEKLDPMSSEIYDF